MTHDVAPFVASGPPSGINSWYNSLLAIRSPHALCGFGSQLSGDALEELTDDRARGPADHALAERRDRPAGADVAGIMEKRARLVGRQLDRTFTFHESGRAAAIDAHLVLGGRLQIVQVNGTAEETVDRADADSQVHIVRPVAGLLELFAARKALGDPARVGEKTPDGDRRNTGECKLSVDLHRVTNRDYFARSIAASTA